MNTKGNLFKKVLWSVCIGLALIASAVAVAVYTGGIQTSATNKGAESASTDVSTGDDVSLGIAGEVDNSTDETVTISYYNGDILLGTRDVNYTEYVTVEETLEDFGGEILDNGADYGWAFNCWEDSAGNRYYDYTSPEYRFRNNTSLYAVYRRYKDVPVVCYGVSYKTGYYGIGQYVVSNDLYSDEQREVVNPHTTYRPIIGSDDDKGWAFAGYNTSVSAAAPTYAVGDYIPTPYGSNLGTYYGVYVRTVTYYSGLGCESEQTITQYMSASASSTKPTVSYTGVKTITAVSGWSAKGWRYDTTAANYEAASNFRQPNYLKNNELYAVYSRTLSVEVDDGNGGTTTATATQYLNSSGAVSDVTISVGSSTPTKSGYVLKGYEVDGAIYDAGSTLTISPSVSSSATLTATAVWQKVNITYKVGSVELGTVEASETGTTTLSTWAALGGANKSPYKNMAGARIYTGFGGWIAGAGGVDPTGTTVLFTDGQSVVDADMTNYLSDDGTITLYAVFKGGFPLGAGYDDDSDEDAELGWQTWKTEAIYCNSYNLAVSSVILPEVPISTLLTTNGYTAVGWTNMRNSLSTDNITEIMSPGTSVVCPFSTATNVVSFTGACAVYRRTITFKSGLNGSITDGTYVQTKTGLGMMYGDVQTATPSAIDGWETFGYYYTADGFSDSSSFSGCTEFYNASISGYGGSTVNVSYDYCNPFGMIAGQFGEISSLSKNTSKSATKDTISAFNSLSELFASFMDNFTIPTTGVKYVPTISSTALSAYTQFYNKAIDIYNNSFMSTPKTDGDLTKSAVIGANYPYSMVFGTDVSATTLDLQTAIANLFGFSSKTDFMGYAQTLADTYAQYRTDIANSASVNEALMNGCFYTEDGSFVFPMFVYNYFTPVLTYVIVDTDGFVSVWVDDIASALKGVNFNSSYYNTTGTLSNTIYCKNALFVTGKTPSPFAKANSEAYGGSTHGNTWYAIYKRGLTISYNGAGATAGSVDQITEYQYLNCAENMLTSVDFVLSQNSYTRRGYTFVGWNVGGTIYEAGDTYTVNPALDGECAYSATAVWEANTITITLENAGGTCDTTNIYYVFDTAEYYSNSTKTTKITSISPTKTGYSLLGYYGDGSCGGMAGEQYISSTGAISSDLCADIYQDATLTAQWSANKYKITLDGQNTTSAGTTMVWYYYNTSKVVDGVSTYYYSNLDCTTALAKIVCPTNTYYTFNGYYTEKYGGGTQYIDANGNFVNNLYSTNAEDITLYAYWMANTATIKLGTLVNVDYVTYEIRQPTVDKKSSVRGATTVGTTQNTLTTSGFTATAGVCYQFTAILSTITGYTVTFSNWSGWYGGTCNPTELLVFMDNGGVYIINATATKTANTYTVTFDANGGSVSTASKSVTYDSTYGDLDTPTRSGYTFAGWFTSADGGTQVTSATQVTTASNHTLYAHWTVQSYTVTFDANGGSCGTLTKQVTYGSTYGDLPIATRSGYTFAGWDTASNVPGTFITSTSQVTATEAHTLYAWWSATVTIKYYSAKVEHSTGIRVGFSNLELNETLKDTYTFGRTIGTAWFSFDIDEYWASNTEYDSSPYNYYISVGSECTLDSEINYLDYYFTPTNTTINIYVAEQISLTIGYNAQAIRDATGLILSTSAGSLSATSLSAGGSVTYVGVCGSSATLAITRGNSSYEYYISAGSECTTDSSVNTLTYTFTPTASGSVTIYVAQRMTATFGIVGSSTRRVHPITINYTVTGGKLSATTQSQEDGPTLVYWYAIYSTTTIRVNIAKESSNPYTYYIERHQYNKENGETGYASGSAGKWYYDWTPTIGASYDTDRCSHDWCIIEQFAVSVVKGTGISDAYYIYSLTGDSFTSHSQIMYKGTCTFYATASDGYTFKGFNTKADGTGTNYTDNPYKWMVNGSLTLYALATANTYEVTFDAQEGSCSTTSKQVTYGSTYGELPTATRTNYTFAGWNTASDGSGSTITSTSTVAISTAHTLYAQWTRNTVTITYYNGDTILGTQTVNTGEQVTLQTFDELGGTILDNGADYGWEFDAWYNQATASTYGTTATFNSSVSVYARYKRTIYFSYCARNSSGSQTSYGGVDQQRKQYVVKPNIVSVTSITTMGPNDLSSYKFYDYFGWTPLGWRDDQEIGEPEYEFYEQVAPAYNASNTFNLVLVRTITFKSGVNGTTENTATQYRTRYSNVVTAGVGYVTSPTPASITGWTSLGWRYDTESGESELSASGEIQPEFTRSNIIYAVYYRSIYLVYHGNGATSGNATLAFKYQNLNSYQNTVSSVSFTLSTNKFVREGYTFAGWKIGSTVYAEGDTYTASPAYDASSTITAYAQWDANSYTVTFDAQGGTITSNFSSMTVTMGNTYGAMPEVTRAGYTFMGWNTASDGSGTTIDSESVVSTPSNHTLYAIWDADSVNFSIKVYVQNANSGSYEHIENQTKTANSGSSVTLAEIADMTNKAVVGGIEYDASTTQTNNSNATSVTINGDGSTEVSIYFSRVQHSAVVDGNGGTPAETSNTYRYGQVAIITAPTRTGYTLSGYTLSNLDTGSSEVGGATISFDSATKQATYVQGVVDVRIKANWQADTYTIKYNANGGSGTMADQSVNFDSPISISANAFSKTGYSFASWTTNADGTDDGYNWTGWSGTWTYVDGQYGISGKVLQLYAIWTADTYTIKYYSNGGSGTMADQSIVFDSQASIKANEFSRTGYTFVTWTINADGTDDGYDFWASWHGTWNFVDGQYGISGKVLRLYARWSANTYTVTFDANGGSCDTTTMEVTYDSEYGELPTPTLTGHTFSYWALGDENGTQITETSIVSTAGNHTLVANWSLDTVTCYVVWFGFYGTHDTTLKVSTNSSDAVLRYNRDSEAPDIIPETMKGLMYVNHPYSTEAITITITTTNTDYDYQISRNSEKGVNTFSFSWTPTASGEYNVIYVAEYYLIKAVCGTGASTATFTATAGENVLCQNVTEAQVPAEDANVEVTLTYATTGASGYDVFKGWYSNAEGTGTAVSTEANYSFAFDSSVWGDITLYAVYIANTYTVEYNSNGGTGSMTASTFTYDVAGNLSANTFTREGYEFDKWNTAMDGTGTYYSNSQLVSNLTSVNGGTITLYAQWLRNQYTVTFDANQGTVTTTTKVVTFDSEYGELPTPTRTGHTFRSWMLNGADITSESIVTTASDHTLIADWTANTYTITFDPDGGEVSTTSKTVTYGQPYGALPTPTQKGYEFVGWYICEKQGVRLTYTTKVTAESIVEITTNKILYAKWEQTFNELRVYLYIENCMLVPEFQITADSTEVVIGEWETSGDTITCLIKCYSTEDVTFTFTANTLFAVIYIIDFGDDDTDTDLNIAGDLNNTWTFMYECSRLSGDTKYLIGFIYDLAKFEIYAGYGTESSELSLEGNTGEPAIWTTDEQGNFVLATSIRTDGTPIYMSPLVFFEGLSKFEVLDEEYGWYFSFITDELFTIKQGYQDCETIGGSDYNGWIFLCTTDGSAMKDFWSWRTYLDIIDSEDEIEWFNQWMSLGFLSFETDEDGNFTEEAKRSMYGSWVLYGVAIPNGYLVDYNANGGEGSMEKSIHTYDLAESLNTNTFTRRGYTFAGWSLSADGEVEYTDGQDVLNLTTEHRETVTLYAVWTPKPVTVVIKNLSGTGAEGTISGSVNGGAISTNSNLSLSAKVGDVITLTSNPTGNSVDKWVKGNLYTSESVGTDSTITYTITVDDGEAGSIEFRACYSVSVRVEARTNYSETEDGTGGTVKAENGQIAGSSNSYSMPFTGNNSLVITATANSGYVFGGWYVDWETKLSNGTLSGSSYVYTLTSSELLQPTTYTYRASFLKQTTLTIDANGGAYPGQTTIVGYYLLTITLSNPTRTGYTFIGWTGVEEHSDDIYVFGLEDGVVVANWASNIYKVSLDNQNADTAGTTEAWYYYNSHQTVSGVDAYYYSDAQCTTPLTDGYKINVPTRTGYTFDGYFLGLNGTDTQYINADGEFINDLYQQFATDTTLYAKWTENIYTITLDNLLADVLGTATIYQKYNIGYYLDSTATTAITSITIPTRTGYGFGGYYTEANGAGTQVVDSTGNIVAGNTQFTSDTQVYVYWTAQQVVVNFDANGGSVSPTYKSVTFDSEYGELPTPTRSGLTFDGWFASSSLTGEAITSSAIVSNPNGHTLYARWKATVEIKFVTGIFTTSAHSTDISLSVTGGTLSASQISNGGTATYTITVGKQLSDITLTVNRVNTAYDYYIGSSLPNSTMNTWEITFNPTSTTLIKVSVYERISLTITYMAQSIKDATDLTLSINATIAELSTTTLSAGETAIVYERRSMGVIHTLTISVANGDYDYYISVDGECTTDSNTNSCTYTYSTTSYMTITIYVAQRMEVEITRKEYATNATNLNLEATGGALTSTTQAKDDTVYWYAIYSTTPIKITATTTNTSRNYLVESAAKEYSWQYLRNGENTTYIDWTPNTNLEAMFTVYEYFTANINAGTGISSATFDTVWQGESRRTNMTSYNRLLYGEQVTFTAVVSDGYTFKDFNTKADGTGTSYTDNPYTISSIENDITLYALTQTNSYVVTMDANGGTFDTANSYSISADGKTATRTMEFTESYATLPIVSREGYIFKEWNTLVEGTGSTITNSSIIEIADNHTIYAIWIPISYTIAFNKNATTASGSMSSVTAIYDVEVALATNGFTNTGYRFDGWALTADGEVKYADKASVINLTSTNGATITLYAKWTAIEYVVTFDANGGEVTPTSKTVTYGQVYGTLPTPTRTGYTFTCWAFGGETGSVDENEVAIITADTIVSYAYDHYLVAQWSANKYKATLDNQGATSKGTTAVWYYFDTQQYYTDLACTTGCTQITKPSKTGYTFNGYYTETNGGGTQYIDADGNFVNDLYSSSASDITLYAYWTAKSSVVTITTNTTYAEVLADDCSKTGTYTVGDVLTLHYTATTNFSLDWWYKYYGSSQKASFYVNNNNSILSYTITEEDMENGNVIFKAVASYMSNIIAAANFYASFFEDNNLGGSVSMGLGASNWSAKNVGNCESNVMSVMNAKPNAGYKFIGWYLRVNPKLDNYTSSMLVSAENCSYVTDGGYYRYTFKPNTVNPYDGQMGGGNFYALFLSETTLTIDANGGTYTGSTSITDLYGSTTTIATPTREGYTFNGWTLTGGGTFENDVYTFGTADGTLTANWSIDNYTLNLEYNGGTMNWLMDDDGYVDGTFESGNTRFTGNWGSGEIGISTNAFNGSKSLRFRVTSLKDADAQGYMARQIELTNRNKWTAGTYTIRMSISASGGTAGTLYPITAYILTSNGWDKRIQINSLVESGVWSLFTSTFTIAETDCDYLNLTIGITDTTGLGLDFYVDDIEITKESYAPTTQFVCNVEKTDSVALPYALKAGYTFVGWNTSSTATASTTTGWVTSYTPSEITENTTYYAIYTLSKPNPTSVGAEPSTLQYDSGKESVVYVDVDTNGQEFTKSYQWYRSTTAGFTPSEATKVAGATGPTYKHTSTTTNIGTYYYKAVITITDGNETTSSLSKTIKLIVTAGDPKLTISMDDYKYDDVLSTPSWDIGHTKSGNESVTFYYNTTNSNSGGTEWKNMTSTSLPVGTYYMYAVIGATGNYASATSSAVAFNVLAGDMVVNILTNSNLTTEPIKDDNGVVVGYKRIYDGEALVGYVNVNVAFEIVYGTTTEYDGGTGSGLANQSAEVCRITEVGEVVYYYKVTADNYNDVTGSIKLVLNKLDVSVEWETTTYTYNGNDQSSAVKAYIIKVDGSRQDCIVTFSGQSSTFKDAGNYTATASLTDTSTYVLVNGTKELTINKLQATITAEDKAMTYGDNAPTYTHSSDVSIPDKYTASYTITNASGSVIEINASTDVGSYTITPNSDLSTSNYDITYVSGVLTIGPYDLAGATISGVEAKTYTGSELTQTITVQALGLTLTENTHYTISYANNINVGTATLTITAVENTNYTGSKSVEFEIEAQAVVVPTTSGANPVYDGTEKTANILENELYTISNNKAIEAGTYTATATLNNPNYVWSTGDANPKSITWVIDKADVELTMDEASVSVRNGQTATNVVNISKASESDVLQTSASISTSGASGYVDISASAISSYKATLTILAKKSANSTQTITVAFSGDKNHNSASTTFEVEIKAITVNIITENGTLDVSEIVSGSDSEVLLGSDITFTATPDEGYGLLNYKVDGSDTQYVADSSSLGSQFTSPTINVTEDKLVNNVLTITATFDKLAVVNVTIVDESGSIASSLKFESTVNEQKVAYTYSSGKLTLFESSKLEYTAQTNAVGGQYYAIKTIQVNDNVKVQNAISLNETINIKDIIDEGMAELIIQSVRIYSILAQDIVDNNKTVAVAKIDVKDANDLVEVDNQSSFAVEDAQILYKVTRNDDDYDFVGMIVDGILNAYDNEDATKWSYSSGVYSWKNQKLTKSISQAKPVVLEKWYTPDNDKGRMVRVSVAEGVTAELVNTKVGYSYTLDNNVFSTGDVALYAGTWTVKSYDEGVNIVVNVTTASGTTSYGFGETFVIDSNTTSVEITITK